MKCHRDCRRVGTLSKSEWEATCKFPYESCDFDFDNFIVKSLSKSF